MPLETRVPVTGAAGFLGSHLCERLLRDGARVICLDNFGPINLGNPDEFSILQPATAVIVLTGSRSYIVHRPKQEHDSKQRRPDISKASELPSWSPAMPLEAGLARTIAYFEQPLRDAAVSRGLAES